jgi:catalase-peroxidase
MNGRKSMDAKTDGTARASARLLTTNRDWWPDQLDIQVLHRNSPSSDPMGEEFDYAKEFKSLDLECRDQGSCTALMTDSQEWWPPTSVTTAG